MLSILVADFQLPRESPLWYRKWALQTPDKVHTRLVDEREWGQHTKQILPSGERKPYNSRCEGYPSFAQPEYCGYSSAFKRTNRISNFLLILAAKDIHPSPNPNTADIHPLSSAPPVFQISYLAPRLNILIF
jgi:hypothetical protein